MAISVDWGTKVISVNKVDMVLVQSTPSEIYELDLDVFRLALGELLDDETGMAFPDTHRYFPPISVGGAALARVIELINDYTVTFEDGQYRAQIVNGNSNLGENVNVNQVSVSTANSAGLQDLGSLQAASFNGAVSVDQTSAYTGTTFPVGISKNPINNMADAHEIGRITGLRTFDFFGNMTLTTASAEDYSDGYEFTSNNPAVSTITVESGVDVSNCTFTNITLQGTLDDYAVVRECAINGLSHNNGFIFQSAFYGTVVLGGGLQAMIMDCYSGIAGAGSPVIDMGGSGQGLALRNYTGGIKITNHTGTDDVSIDMASGHVIIDSTVTAGTIYVRGNAKLTDNSTGTTVVDSSALIVEQGLTKNQFLALK